MSKLKTTFTGALTAALALSLVATSPADARRGGSFGSRGYRTYSAPRPTRTTPNYTPPVQRSMTPQQPGQNGYRPTGPSYMPGYQNTGAFGRPRMGFGTGLMAGLLTGGLIGGLMGHGWGMGWGGMGGGWGMGGGFLTILIQLLVVGFIISLVMRMYRRRQAFAGGGWNEPAPFATPFSGGPQPAAGPWGGAATPPNGGPWSASDEIAVTASDRTTFERMLIDVQTAFAREDYGRLRELCTPEVMGYLAEELSQNATHGRKNDVTGTRLLQSDVSEAWSEADADYATVALNYESIDVMRDRTSGAVVEGDPNRPTQTTELWTFVRRAGGPWKLSAIQET